MIYRIHYNGSYFWLVFWAIIFFPIAIVLLTTSWRAEGGDRKLQCRYNGSRFWLGFWTLCFFPIVFFLLLLNGFRIENAQ